MNHLKVHENVACDQCDAEFSFKKNTTALKHTIHKTPSNRKKKTIIMQPLRKDLAYVGNLMY